MKKTLSLLALFAVLMTASFAQTPLKAPNIGYLAMGYNVYQGDPLASTVDPGFMVSSIFSLTYSQQQTSPDGKYLVPDNVTIASEDSCVLNSAATAITGANSYLKSLDVFASVDGGCPFGGFSASTNYNAVSQSTSESSTFYTLETGQCSVYVADITLMDFPELDSQFIQNAIAFLDTSDSNSHYQFLDSYGTHYVQEITMGSRLSVMNSVSESAWESLESQGISVTTAAQASFMGIYAGFSQSTSTQNTQASSYQSASTNFQTTTIGSLPPSYGNSIAWAQQAVNNPMPIKYSLSPLTDIFTSPNFVAATQTIANISSESLSTIQANLKAALEGGYCQYLLNQDSVATCSAIGPDQPIPVSNGSCVMCASGCGGNYTQSQGAFDVLQEQPTWLMDYPNSCVENPGLGNNKYYLGVDLCCMPEIQGQIQGSCRMCSTCGGQYPHLNGGLWDNFVLLGSAANGWMEAYGDSCEGNLRPQGATVQWSGFDLCCDQPDVCSFCATCGGDYPYETGVIGVDDTSQPAFSFLGEQCSGTLESFGYKQVPGVGGMQLCCSNFN